MTHDRRLIMAQNTRPLMLILILVPIPIHIPITRVRSSRVMPYARYLLFSAARVRRRLRCVRNDFCIYRKYYYRNIRYLRFRKMTSAVSGVGYSFILYCIYGLYFFVEMKCI